MKVAGKILVSLMVVGILMTYTGCKKKKGDPEPITDQQIEKLSKPWKIDAVTLGNDRTADFANFTITFTGTKGVPSIGYTTAGGKPTPSPWASSGVFTFDANTPETKLKRDDGVDVTYSVTETRLQMNFQYNDSGFGRVNAVRGDWVFTFKQ
jgi:hypothetical protein